MLEPELAHASGRCATNHRSVASGLQHRAPTQFVGIPDTGRIRSRSCRATGVSPHAGRHSATGLARTGKWENEQAYTRTGTDAWYLRNESTDSSRPNASRASQDDQSAEDFPLKGNGWADFYTIHSLDVNRAVKIIEV